MRLLGHQDTFFARRREAEQPARALVRHSLIAGAVSPQLLRWITAASFLAVAAWSLIPDKADDNEAARGSGYGVLLATIVSFFLAEIGDKTQIATAVLAAQYHALVPVVLGTTLGMMIADVPAVLIAANLAHRIPLAAVRIAAAVLFAVLGVLALFAPYSA